MVELQYSIVLVNLNPTVGSEIKKTRPCLIISPDEMNRHLNTVIVAPLTSTTKPYPSRTHVVHKGKKGMIALDQIRTIDKARIIKEYSTITKSNIKRVKSVLKEMLID